MKLQLKPECDLFSKKKKKIKLFENSFAEKKD